MTTATTVLLSVSAVLALASSCDPMGLNKPATMLAEGIVTASDKMQQSIIMTTHEMQALSTELASDKTTPERKKQIESLVGAYFPFLGGDGKNTLALQRTFQFRELPAGFSGSAAIWTMNASGVNDLLVNQVKDGLGFNWSKISPDEKVPDADSGYMAKIAQLDSEHLDLMVFRSRVERFPSILDATYQMSATANRPLDPPVARGILATTSFPQGKPYSFIPAFDYPNDRFDPREHPREKARLPSAEDWIEVARFGGQAGVWLDTSSYAECAPHFLLFAASGSFSSNRDGIKIVSRRCLQDSIAKRLTANLNARAKAITEHSTERLTGSGPVLVRDVNPSTPGDYIAVIIPEADWKKMPDAKLFYFTHAYGKPDRPLPYYETVQGQWKEISLRRKQVKTYTTEDRSRAVDGKVVVFLARLDELEIVPFDAQALAGVKK